MREISPRHEAHRGYAQLCGFILAAAALLAGIGGAHADSYDYCMDRCLQDHSCSTTSRESNYCGVTRGECSGKCSSAGSSSGRQQSTVTYGALAYSPDTGATGWSYNYGSEARALKACGARARDCVVTQTIHDFCAAVVDGDDHKAPASAVGSTLVKAEGLALAACRTRGGKSCKVAGEVCTPHS
jgi:hypothetical protein